MKFSMRAEQDVKSGASGVTGWRRSLAQYSDRRVLLILPLGFASGLPLVLTASTLSAWFATVGVSRATIGAFALVGMPYALKFLWSPLIDRLPPPIPLGRRRGWGIAIQLALIAATLALGSCNPKTELARMGALAMLVAFLSASQDVVIDAYRVEILTPEQQGPGAAMIQTGYRIAMLISGAGALIIAARYGWFAAYATMAALLRRRDARVHLRARAGDAAGGAAHERQGLDGMLSASGSRRRSRARSPTSCGGRCGRRS